MLLKALLFISVEWGHHRAIGPSPRCLVGSGGPDVKDVYWVGLALEGCSSGNQAIRAGLQHKLLTLHMSVSSPTFDNLGLQIGQPHKRSLALESAKPRFRSQLLPSFFSWILSEPGFPFSEVTVAGTLPQRVIRSLEPRAGVTCSGQGLALRALDQPSRMMDDDCQQLAATQENKAQPSVCLLPSCSSLLLQGAFLATCS